MINSILIDGEQSSLEILENFISRIPYLKLVGKYNEPLLSVPVLKSGNIDLLFLDVEMPGILSGIDFYRSLSDKPEVIFTSADIQFAFEGFELRAIDYLLKPIAFEKFVTACNRASDFLKARNNQRLKRRDYFFINAAHKMHKVFFNDILYVEGMKDYSKIHLSTTQSPLIVLYNLKYFEEFLGEPEFIRIHRSYIVSVRMLNTLSRKSVTIGKSTLPVSDNYRDRFLALVK